MAIFLFLFIMIGPLMVHPVIYFDNKKVTTMQTTINLCQDVVDK